MIIQSNVQKSWKSILFSNTLIFCPFQMIFKVGVQYEKPFFIYMHMYYKNIMVLLSDIIEINSSFKNMWYM